jgi:CheY-like chemotaxis protein
MPKILCADDSVTIQKVIAITFGGVADFTVESAKSADEALAMARASRPDLVLADAVMPGGGKLVTGYDLCAALKSDPATAGCVVAILCGNSQAYDEARGKAVGADGHFTKPWDTQVMCDNATKLLAKVMAEGGAKPAVGVAATPAPTPTPTPVVPKPVVTSQVGTAPAVGRQAVVSTQLGSATAPKPATPTPSLAQNAAAAAAASGLPKPPPGLPRPPLIRGVGQPGKPAATPAVARPATTPAPTPTPTPAVAKPITPVAPTRPTPPQPSMPPGRSATIMGMPAVAMPPLGGAGVAPTVPVRQAPNSPATPIISKPAVIPAVTPVAVTPVAAPPAGPVAKVDPPPPVAVEKPVADLAARAAPVVAAVAMPKIQEAVAARGGDPRGVEYEAIAKLSREIIEQIVWEVVPDLAEAIIRENLDRLTAAKQ